MNNKPYYITKSEICPLITINKIDKMENNMISQNFTNYNRDNKIIWDRIYRGYEPAHINFIRSNVNTDSLSRNQSASKCAERFATSEIIKYKSLGIFLSLPEEIFDSKFNENNTFSKIQNQLKYICFNQKYSANHIHIIVDISPNTIIKLIEAKKCTTAIEKTLHKIWLAQKIIPENPLEEILKHWIEKKTRYSPLIVKSQNQDKNKKQILKQLSNNNSLRAIHEKLNMEDLPDD